MCPSMQQQLAAHVQQLSHTKHYVGFDAKLKGTDLKEYIDTRFIDLAHIIVV